MNWISVNDQLPEADQWIIYHAPDIFSSEYPRMWVGKYVPDDNVFFGTGGFFGGGEVSHWMPAPQLPERK